MQAHSDLALVERSRAHEAGAFEQIYRTHAPRLFGLAVRLVGRTEAEDVLQEMFLTAYRKLDQYKGNASLGTWLFRLGVNVCVDHLRRRGVRFTAETGAFDEEPPAGPAAAGAIGGVLDRIDLERAIAALPAGYRAAFVLHDVEGLGHGEIADMLGVSEGTSKSQLHRARLRLRAALGAGSLSEAGGAG